MDYEGNEGVPGNSPRITKGVTDGNQVNIPELVEGDGFGKICKVIGF
jgi:hypothetical protein